MSHRNWKFLAGTYLETLSLLDGIQVLKGLQMLLEEKFYLTESSQTCKVQGPAYKEMLIDAQWQMLVVTNHLSLPYDPVHEMKFIFGSNV